MHSYIKSEENKISFVIDDDADNFVSFEKAKKYIESNYSDITVIEYSPPVWSTGKFIYIWMDMEIELVFSDFFGGTELLVDVHLTKDSLELVKKLAESIYELIHNTEKNDVE